MSPCSSSPIGFGAILVNLPLSSVLSYGGSPGWLQILYDAGIKTELLSPPHLRPASAR